jgi:hypothetical protein
MANHAAELSSITSTFDEQGRRLTALAEELSGDPDQETAALALFEAERSLRVAVRALERATRSLA